MMKALQLNLLGNPGILHGEEPITSSLPAKAQALLYYLAMTRRPHSRAALAALLWPEASHAQASKSLRNRLSELRKQTGAHLVITPQMIALNPASKYGLDVAQFQAGLADITGEKPDLAHWRAAIALYKGDFLEGFHLHDALPFEEWVIGQRTHLRELLLTALYRLALHEETQARYAPGLEHVSRLLALEPWHEEGHQLKMRLLARSGQRSAALLQYEICRRVLANELDVTPLSTTTALYEQIRRGEVGGEPKREGGPFFHKARSDKPTARALLLEQVQNKQGIRASRSQEKRASRLLAAGQIHQSSGIRQTEQMDARLLTLDSGLMPPDATLAPTSLLSHDLSTLPRRNKLYGRQRELATLRHWLTVDGCQLVIIVGIGGQGKTSLAAEVAHTLATDGVQHGFARVIWCSLLNAPPLSEILLDWLQRLTDLPSIEPTATLDQQLNLLLTQLQHQRCLLVLDNVESILVGSSGAGDYRAGFETYNQLFARLGQGQHQSCCLLTGRVTPKTVADLEEDTPTVRVLPLAGLESDAGRALLHAYGANGRVADASLLIGRYSGNPLGLKIAASTICDFFAGDVAAFLRQDLLLFDDIHAVLNQQFTSLSVLEQELLIWLAITRVPTSFVELWELLAQPSAKRMVMDALRTLQRRALLEPMGERFTLQNVVTEFVTEHLIEAMYGEMERNMEDAPFYASGSRLDHPFTLPYLSRYALVLAQAKEYVRQVQVRLLLAPIATRLLQRWGKTGVVQRVQMLLERLRTHALYGASYAAANLLHLLLHLELDVAGCDFSQLTIRQADLRRATLAHLNFADAELAGCVFTEPMGMVTATAFSPDGQLLAVGTFDGLIRLWRVADRQLYGVCQGHTDIVYTLAFSPHPAGAGNLLASGGFDQTIRLWEVGTEAGNWQTYQCLAGNTGRIHAVAFSPDGRLLASAGSDHTVRLWDVATGQLRQILQGHTNHVHAVTFSPHLEGTRTLLASGSADQTVCLWDGYTGQLLATMHGHTAEVYTVAFNPTGDLLASGSADRTVRLWDGHSAQPLDILPGHAAEVYTVAFSPAGNLLASGSFDRTVRLWDVSAQGEEGGIRGQLRQTLTAHTHWIWSVVFSPRTEGASALLVSGSFDHTVRLWDGHTGQALYTWHGYTAGVHALAFSPDGATVASGCADHLIRLWELHGQMSGDPHLRCTLSGHDDLVTAVAFSPDGETLASASDHTVRLWRVAPQGNPHLGASLLRHILFRHPGRVFALAFSPDGQILASGGDDKTVQLWNLTPQGAGQLRDSLHGHRGRIRSIAFSPDGETLASGSIDQTVRLWDVRTGQLRQELCGHTGWVYTVAFHPNGEMLASAGFDGTVRLWNVATGRLRCVLSGHRLEVRSILFHPNGTLLASGSNDETIKLWDLTTGTCLQTLQPVGPYAGMNIIGVTGITAVQKVALKALGAIEKFAG